MNSKLRLERRPGAILPMVALCMMGIMGCLALAIDLGLIASARTQAQASADSAAMSGARTMNGDQTITNNLANVMPNAQTSATGNKILSRPIIDKMVKIESGSYTYNDSLKKFEMNIGAPPSGENYSLVRATVSTSDPSLSPSEKIEATFGKVLGMTYINIETRATAAHRPRDVAVILDHSGSMRFDSLLGIPSNGDRSQSNNPDSVFPLFGGYSGSANLQNTNDYTTIGTTIYGAANISTTTDGGEAIVLDFYQHAKNATPVKAFGPPDVTLPPDSYATTPEGDNYQRQHDSATYAQTTQQIINSSANAGGSADGWKGYTQPPYAGYPGAATPVPEFAGYTRGPNYWGKTFWIWPPDPRAANDWRQKFFGTSNNQNLYDGSGNWRAAKDSGTTNYTVNYTAILNWIKNTGPNPFPPRLRAGRILYYDAIPTTITGDFPTNNNERFWKLYIDYCLGLCQMSASDYDVITARTGYGADFTWGTTRITGNYNATGQINNTSGYAIGHNSNINLDNWSNGSGPSIGHRIEVPTGSNNWYTVVSGSGSSPRLDRPLVAAVANNDGVRVVTTNVGVPYFDNPKRPKLHFWFGPMTMVDFLGNYNLTDATYDDFYDFRWPGTCHEAPLYTQKLGVRASLQDMQKNHPNDSVSMMMFSTPKYSSGGAGQFNRTRGPLGRKYRRLEDALFYPPDTIADDNGGATANDIGVFDATANNEVPRSEGSTCPVMGFMLAYNQFSANSTLKTWAPAPAPTGEAGGLGRKGAQKLIIFLTDGVANTAASAGFVNAGSHNSYYQIRQPGEFPSNSGTVTTQLYGVCDRICALETASPSGYSTTRKPVLIHSLAFGTLFEPSTTSSDKTTALGILQNVAWRGKTLASASTPLPDDNRIIGDSANRIAKLQLAFKRIMQDGVQVSLLE